jgi:predicted transcriptional regulator
MNNYPWIGNMSSDHKYPAIQRYEKLLKEIDTTDRSELYTNLMSKEKDTLDIVNRVANVQKDFTKPLFFQESIFNILKSCYTLIVTIFQKFKNQESIHSILDKTLYTNANIFYIGCILLIMSVLFVCFI